MAAAEPNTKPKVRTTASQRQMDFVQRKREAGLVMLTGLFVPEQLKGEIRKLVAEYVENWQAGQSL